MVLLIVDDNAQMRRQLRKMIGSESDKIYECSDGSEALAAYQRHRPDWVLMDIEMARLDGISATREIVAFEPLARIVIVTQHDEPSLRAAARTAGAVAYLLKDDLLAIRSFIQRETMN